jgi:hypothetical protein
MTVAALVRDDSHSSRSINACLTGVAPVGLRRWGFGFERGEIVLMLIGQIIHVDPAHAVRGPKHSQRRGKTPVLQADEARTLIYAIDTTSLPALRDRSFRHLHRQHGK